MRLQKCIQLTFILISAVGANHKSGNLRQANLDVDVEGTKVSLTLLNGENGKPCEERT